MEQRDGARPRMKLRAALGSYPHTAALKSGAVTSAFVELAFEEHRSISRAFAPMVREGRYDLCEMAIATFLMAKAYHKPLVLLPVCMAARFQESALLCRRDGPVAGPADLAGKRVGVRAYSQTTGLWLRGTLEEVHGVEPTDIRWTSFEDAHVAEYEDPPWVNRAPPGADMLAMLKAGQLDAAIFGAETPADPDLRPVFPDVAAAEADFLARRGLMPVNHLVVITRRMAAVPGLTAELLRMLDRAAAGAPPLPRGRQALTPALMLANDWCADQGLLQRPLTEAEIWDGSPSE